MLRTKVHQQKIQTWQGYHQDVIREKGRTETEEMKDFWLVRAMEGTHLKLKKKKKKVAKESNQGLMFLEIEMKLRTMKSTEGFQSR